MSRGIFSKYDKERLIIIPKPSGELSEFFGILFGDGHLIERGRIHRIGITLNYAEDRCYSRYVIKLIENLFGIEPRTYIREKQNRCDIIIHSKAISKFINKYFPSGKKHGKLNIPCWVVNNRKYFLSFVRGLVDTDGSLFFAKRGTYSSNKYPVIEITSYDRRFLIQLRNLLLKCGFNVNIVNNKIQLNGKKQLEKWISEIGFKNMNSLSRH